MGEERCCLRYASLLFEDPTCESGDFLCDNGQCITKYWVCDGLADCLDGTDEEERTCSACPYEFLCSNGRCTYRENICDGINHCEDNSDEDHICVGEIQQFNKKI